MGFQPFPQQGVELLYDVGEVVDGRDLGLRGDLVDEALHLPGDVHDALAVEPLVEVVGELVADHLGLRREVGPIRRCRGGRPLVWNTNPCHAEQFNSEEALKLTFGFVALASLEDLFQVVPFQGWDHGTAFLHVAFGL